MYYNSRISKLISSRHISINSSKPILIEGQNFEKYNDIIISCQVHAN